MTYIRIIPPLFGLLAATFTTAALFAGQAAEPPDCFTRLTLGRVKFERPRTLPSPPLAACIIAEPVVLVSVTAAHQAVEFPDRPLLSCAMAERLAGFSTSIFSPMTLAAFGKPLTSVSTGPGFECRPRNRKAGAKISSHGQGNAVDIMTATLADGTNIVVEKPDGPGVVKFLDSFRAAACEAFSTVLGPGSDPSHANHIHIDIERRGKSGTSKFCQ